MTGIGAIQSHRMQVQSQGSSSYSLTSCGNRRAPILEPAQKGGSGALMGNSSNSTPESAENVQLSQENNIFRNSSVNPEEHAKNSAVEVASETSDGRKKSKTGSFNIDSTAGDTSTVAGDRYINHTRTSVLGGDEYSVSGTDNSPSSMNNQEQGGNGYSGTHGNNTVTNPTYVNYGAAHLTSYQALNPYSMSSPLPTINLPSYTPGPGGVPNLASAHIMSNIAGVSAPSSTPGTTSVANISSVPGAPNMQTVHNTQSSNDVHMLPQMQNFQQVQGLQNAHSGLPIPQASPAPQNAPNVQNSSSANIFPTPPGGPNMQSVPVVPCSVPGGAVSNGSISPAYPLFSQPQQIDGNRDALSQLLYLSQLKQALDDQMQQQIAAVVSKLDPSSAPGQMQLHQIQQTQLAQIAQLSQISLMLAPQCNANQIAQLNLTSQYPHYVGPQQQALLQPSPIQIPDASQGSANIEHPRAHPPPNAEAVPQLLQHLNPQRLAQLGEANNLPQLDGNLSQQYEQSEKSEKSQKLTQNRNLKRSNGKDDDLRRIHPPVQPLNQVSGGSDHIEAESIKDPASSNIDTEKTPDDLFKNNFAQQDQPQSQSSTEYDDDLRPVTFLKTHKKLPGIKSFKTNIAVQKSNIIISEPKNARGVKVSDFFKSGISNGYTFSGNHPPGKETTSQDGQSSDGRRDKETRKQRQYRPRRELGLKRDNSTDLSAALDPKFAKRRPGPKKHSEKSKIDIDSISGTSSFQLKVPKYSFLSLRAQQRNTRLVQQLSESSAQNLDNPAFLIFKAKIDKRNKHGLAGKNPEMPRDNDTNDQFKNKVSTSDSPTREIRQTTSTEASKDTKQSNVLKGLRAQDDKGDKSCEDQSDTSIDNSCNGSLDGEYDTSPLQHLGTQRIVDHQPPVPSRQTSISFSHSASLSNADSQPNNYRIESPHRDISDSRNLRKPASLDVSDVDSDVSSNKENNNSILLNDDDKSGKLFPIMQPNGRYKCSLCPKTFKHAKHVNRHGANHYEVRKHQCRRCFSTFTRRDLLSRHRETCRQGDDRSPESKPLLVKGCHERVVVGKDEHDQVSEKEMSEVTSDNDNQPE